MARVQCNGQAKARVKGKAKVMPEGMGGQGKGEAKVRGKARVQGKGKG